MIVCITESVNTLKSIVTSVYWPSTTGQPGLAPVVTMLCYLYAGCGILWPTPAPTSPPAMYNPAAYHAAMQCYHASRVIHQVRPNTSITAIQYTLLKNLLKYWIIVYSFLLSLALDMESIPCFSGLCCITGGMLFLIYCISLYNISYHSHWPVYPQIQQHQAALQSTCPQLHSPTSHPAFLPSPGGVLPPQRAPDSTGQPLNLSKPKHSSRHSVRSFDHLVSVPDS